MNDARQRLLTVFKERAFAFGHFKLASGKESTYYINSKKVLFQKYFPGKAFVPPVCSAPITVFRLADQPWYRKNDLTMGWGDRSRLAVKVRNVSGHHLTMMRQPFVQKLASMLAEDLDAAARGNQTAR